jgi:hypothetical protein
MLARLAAAAFLFSAAVVMSKIDAHAAFFPASVSLTLSGAEVSDVADATAVVVADADAAFAVAVVKPAAVEVAIAVAVAVADDETLPSEPMLAEA